MKWFAWMFLVAALLPSGCVGPPPTRQPQSAQRTPATNDACKRLAIPDAGDEQQNALREKACRALSHHDGAFVGCSLQVLGNGSARMLTIQTECGGDSCSFRSWICSGATGDELVPLEHRGGSVEASPDGSFVLTDEGGVLSRVDLASMRSSPSAACLSPVLSPSGRWFVCRSRDYDVLRFPVNGGPLETVVRSGLREGQGYYVAYSYGWAPAVKFVSATEIEFAVIAPPDVEEVRHATWSE